MLHGSEKLCSFLCVFPLFIFLFFFLREVELHSVIPAYHLHLSYSCLVNAICIKGNRRVHLLGSDFMYVIWVLLLSKRKFQMSVFCELTSVSPLVMWLCLYFMLEIFFKERHKIILSANYLNDICNLNGGLGEQLSLSLWILTTINGNGMEKCIIQLFLTDVRDVLRLRPL